MVTDPQELTALCLSQPPPNSEEFWKQVETARALSPNSELSAAGEKISLLPSTSTPPAKAA